MKKWKAMSYSWMRKYAIIKTPILSKLIYKLNSIPNRIQQEITRGNWITRASHSYKNLNWIPVFYHTQNYNSNGLNVDEKYKNLGRNSKKLWILSRSWKNLVIQGRKCRSYKQKDTHI